jgi:hypothetical protein
MFIIGPGLVSILPPNHINSLVEWAYVGLVVFLVLGL